MRAADGAVQIERGGPAFVLCERHDGFEEEVVHFDFTRVWLTSGLEPDRRVCLFFRIGNLTHALGTILVAERGRDRAGPGFERIAGEAESTDLLIEAVVVPAVAALDVVDRGLAVHADAEHVVGHAAVTRVGEGRTANDGAGRRAAHGVDGQGIARAVHGAD